MRLYYAFRRDSQTARIDDEGTRSLLLMAHSAGVERVAFTSSTSALKDAPSSHGRSKHAIGQMLNPGATQSLDDVLRPAAAPYTVRR
jgi:nucleoside-diphosphate-sugar epimerase